MWGGKSRKRGILAPFSNPIRILKIGRDAMRTKRKISEFKNAIEIEEFLDGRYGAPGEKRGEKKKATPEQIERVNQWNREKKARHRLRMYFDVNDWFMTLTYPRDKKPPDMKTVQKHLKAFNEYMRKEYRKRGYELRWIRNIECGPREDNWHVHLVINQIPDADIIASKAWKKFGTVRDKQRLYDKGEFKKLAQYLTKNEKTEEKYVEAGILDHKVNEANYSTSRNMPLPEPKVKRFVRWPKEPRIPKGWYIDKEAYYEGINKATGYPYRHYTLIRMVRRE